MNYTVGAYSFNPGKKFKSNSEAIKHIQERYPHLGEDEIVKHLKPSVQNESNQPTGTIEESSESEKANTKTGERSADRKQAGKD